MRKYFAITALALSSIAYSQNMPHALSSAVQQSAVVNNILPVFNPELSFYSKNYNEVFGKYHYTFSTQNLGARDVYVSPDSRLYFNAGHTFITQMPIAGLNTTSLDRYSNINPLGAIISILGGSDDSLHFKFKHK